MDQAPLFDLGECVATPAALEALAASGESAAVLLRRHISGDWGTVCPEDRRANDAAVAAGERVLSEYRLRSGEVIWIITEADRGSTCVLLPGEY